jgi:hypothetical protein
MTGTSSLPFGMPTRPPVDWAGQVAQNLFEENFDALPILPVQQDSTNAARGLLAKQGVSPIRLLSLEMS